MSEPYRKFLDKFAMTINTDFLSLEFWGINLVFSLEYNCSF